TILTMPRKPASCTYKECVVVDATPQHNRDYHSPSPACVYEDAYSVSFSRIEDIDWKYKCKCNNTYLVATSMARHAKKECPDVTEAIESALEANENFTCPSMTITLRSTRKKESKEISTTESSDSVALTKHIQLLVSQTDEMRKEQRQRDQEQRQRDQEQRQRDQRFDNFFERTADALYAIVQLQKDKEEIKKKLESTMQEQDGKSKSIILRPQQSNNLLKYLKMNDDQDSEDEKIHKDQIKN
ncbi:hypothetical protein BGX27_004695, partial [Mortierella sp. AM989]